MRSIWKYPLLTGADTKFEMPVGAKILCVQIQGQSPAIPTLWALVNPESVRETRTFQIFGTGWEMGEEPGPYVGTFQLHGGDFVFHVFEKVGP